MKKNCLPLPSSECQSSAPFAAPSHQGQDGFPALPKIVFPWRARHSRNNYPACKVVTKSSLKTNKAKTKLYAGIKIHKALEHLNVVRLIDCFEDEENAYMTLELCPSGSLMNMLHRRRVFSEPVAYFFMVRLIGACRYMHIHQVIHGDLKLGNLFFHADLKIEVGGFGLAALIESTSERKKTICGTPNYIVPEVLFDTANGHSFEFDTWSIGVILYAFVVGRSPFQTKDVKEVYQHIRDNQYGFPSHREASLDGREPMQQVLTPDPQEWHPYTISIVPGFTLISISDMSPDFRHISPLVSQHANSTGMSRHPRRKTSSLPPQARVAQAASHSRNANFRRQCNPAAQSPCSQLCTSAAHGRPWRYRRRREEDAAKSPAKSLKASNRLQGITEEGGAGAVAYEKQGEEVRMKELQSQKARIVAQMVPAQLPRSAESPFEDAENMPAPMQEPAPGADGPQDRQAAPTSGTGTPKYGMDYALTDGSVGVHLNDSTMLVLAADKQHFDYISSRRQGTMHVRKKYTVADCPEELESKYLRTKHVMVFELSHDVLQIILSAQGLSIAHIDKNYVLMRWTLSQVMARALLPPPSDPDQAKLAQRLLDKLKYCKEVLLSIRNASASASGSGSGSENGGGVSAKPSKATLR
ncbi:kinase-like domain-containing protein [Lactarius quietus]|nr:kinase-like domain-containing protein [Lactarius quietus]